MKKATEYIGFIVLLMFLTLLYSFATVRNGAKKVKNTVVEFEAGDNNFLTHSLVDKLLIQNNQFVKNQPKSVVDLHLLEKNVSASPYVEKATVFLTVTGELRLIIRQRKPLARVVSKNSSFYIDKYGVKMPLSKNFSARVPLISGVEDSENIKEITKLVTLINSDEFLIREIIAIHKTINNEYNLTVRSGNYKIYFGKFENASKKIKKIKAFYNKAFADKTINNYSVINLKYHNQVVCTKQSQNGKQ